MVQKDYVPRIWKVIALLTVVITTMVLAALRTSLIFVFLAVYIPSLDFHDGRVHTLGEHFSFLLLAAVMGSMAFASFFKALNHFRSVMTTYGVPWGQRISVWFTGVELPSPQIDFVYGFRSYWKASSKPPEASPSTPSPVTPERYPSYGGVRFFSDN